MARLARLLLTAATIAATSLAAPWAMSSAGAAPGDMTVVSVNPDGTPSQGYRQSVSADGRYVAFESYSPLVAGDTSGERDVFVRDLLTGVTTRVSVDSAGVEANGFSSSPSISGDGRLVAFYSDASNLVAGDTNDSYDVFVHDRESGETVRVSLDEDGNQGGAGIFGGHSYSPVLSLGGGYVAFSSYAPLTDADTSSQADAYRVDLATHQVDLVSAGTDGFAVGGGAESISADGQTVAFNTGGNSTVVADDTNNANDIFVRDFADGQVSRVSVGPNGEQGNSGSHYAELSADGRFVAFSTQSTNWGNPNNTYLDVFRHDRETGRSELVSVAAGGGPQDGWAAWPSMSGDGRMVAFHSDSTNLTPDPTGGLGEVFVRDMATGLTVLASPSMAGEVADGHSQVPVLSADGAFVTFESGNTKLAPNAARGSVYRYELDWTDRTAPGVTIDDGPAGRSADATPRFGFSSEDGTAEFACSLAAAGGPADFTACTSPVTYPTQVDGDYVFKVRATDPAGNVGEPATHAFTIDTTGPPVSLQGGPPAVTGDNTPTFPFSAEPGTTFQCSLSSGPDAFEPCTSPVTFPAQPDGPVTFKVLGTDALGNVGPLTQYTFTIDATPASVDIVSGPSGLTSDNTVRFEFASESGVAFECSLSSGADAFEPCESPATYPPRADGDYLFKVRGTDGAGNLSPATTAAFTIDTAAPAVALDSTPPQSSTQDSAAFAFSSEAGAAFECSLSTGVASYEACESPTTYVGLAPDDYVFLVRATDAAGNLGAPTAFAFTVEPDVVDVPAPSTPNLTDASDTGLSSSDDVTSDTTPTFTGTAPVGATVSILVDGMIRGTVSVTAAGTYSVTTTSIPVGSRTVAAVATDSAGHASPASATLTVQVVGPTACHTATNRLNGSAANNTLSGTRLADLMFGLGGNDVLQGKANNDCLVGGTGIDDLQGAAGNDELVGEDGNDKLALGAGTDTATGGAGNDRIFARDGELDRIDCGAGTADIATVDNLDIAVNCETVRVG